MPNLVKIGRDNTIDENEIDNSGREISHRGNLLDLTLPKFTEVTNQLDILENFGRYVFRSSQHDNLANTDLPQHLANIPRQVPEVVNIHSYAQQNIVFPAQGVIEELYLTGNMTAVMLPVLQSIRRLVLYKGPLLSSCENEFAVHSKYLSSHKVLSHTFFAKTRGQKQTLNLPPALYPLSALE
ncbi:uncharacterized protein RSE6_13999 [Rhynchosporium secalis]|uniref:Uncharacterized protein n=1 Tax=Rhynchosporium secalis TaxID=38038 RepID=A0A1E1MUZ6_RHYSE|nr:uncharacterized protein RSE6_13999 [Rhynchosporium secalis]